MKFKSSIRFPETPEYSVPIVERYYRTETPTSQQQYFF